TQVVELHAAQTHDAAPGPVAIQHGMAAAASRWRLARAAPAPRQLGVVAGTARDTGPARQRLDGDPGGPLRRADAHRPAPGAAHRVRDRWFVPGGPRPGRPYRAHAMLTVDPSVDHLELLVLANFGEVWLAREGHDGEVGINYLEKIQMGTAPSAYG